jgi:hypothetical protein
MKDSENISLYVREVDCCDAAEMLDSAYNCGGVIANKTATFGTKITEIELDGKRAVLIQSTSGDCVLVDFNILPTRNSTN